MLEMQVVNFHKAVKDFDRLKKICGDLRHYFQYTLRDDIERETRKVWDAEGPGWKPLKASTLAKKRRRGWSLRILVATGRYREAATNLTHLKYEKLRMTYTINFPYAKIHEYGTARIPARPFLPPLAKRMRREIKSNLPRYIHAQTISGPRQLTFLNMDVKS